MSGIAIESARDHLSAAERSLMMALEAVGAPTAFQTDKPHNDPAEVVKHLAAALALLQNVRCDVDDLEHDLPTDEEEPTADAEPDDWSLDNWVQLGEMVHALPLARRRAILVTIMRMAEGEELGAKTVSYAVTNIDSSMQGIRQALDSLWYYARDAVGNKEVPVKDAKHMIDEEAFRLLQNAYCVDQYVDKLRELDREAQS